jgi:hypothetical protein
MADLFASPVVELHARIHDKPARKEVRHASAS